MVGRVVIIGGGFAGLSAAKELGGHSNIDVTLIDRRNYHLFQPLLYQVATAGLSPADIAAPIRSILARFPNIKVVLGNVTDVDLKSRRVRTQEQTFEYDYLVIACGAKHSYFGRNDWEEAAPGLKTLEQATEIRRRILFAFEQAEKETDLERQRQWLTFVIVGAGPTGVELAGAISEISQYTLRRDFRFIDPGSTRVILVEGGPRVLAAFPDELSDQACKDLKSLGVTVVLNQRVTDVNDDGVCLGDKDFIKSNTILWAAGVQPSSLSKTLGAPLDRAGRVIVEQDLSLKDYPEVFVVGDQAHATGPDGQPLPGLAPVAMQEGRFAARMVINSLWERPRENFKYLDKGIMATIGRRKAVVEYGKLRISGFLAWVMWLFVHIYYLIGFKNKVAVIFQWAWSYLTFKRGARLIVDKEWRSATPAQVSPPLDENKKEPLLKTVD